MLLAQTKTQWEGHANLKQDDATSFTQNHEESLNDRTRDINRGIPVPVTRSLRIEILGLFRSPLEPVLLIQATTFIWIELLCAKNNMIHTHNLLILRMILLHALATVVGRRALSHLHVHAELGMQKCSLQVLHGGNGLKPVCCTDCHHKTWCTSCSEDYVRLTKFVQAMVSPFESDLKIPELLHLNSNIKKYEYGLNSKIRKFKLKARIRHLCHESFVNFQTTTLLSSWQLHGSTNLQCAAFRRSSK